MQKIAIMFGVKVFATIPFTKVDGTKIYFGEHFVDVQTQEIPPELQDQVDFLGSYNPLAIGFEAVTLSGNQTVKVVQKIKKAEGVVGMSLDTIG